MTKRVIDINTVNKVKIETLKEMDDSIFSDVYKRASNILNRAIQDNHEYLKNKKLEDRMPEMISNTISFLGNRGRGKTSAMLSFLFNLIELQKKYTDKDSLDLSNNFIFLPYIDAAMLAQKEYVLDVVLAKMWDRYIKECEKKSKQDDDLLYLQGKVKDKFVNVRKAYLVLKEKENAKQSRQEDSEESMANVLHKLSVSMNLRKELTELVSAFIEFCSKDGYGSSSNHGILLIAIDDLDMSENRAVEILEQVRRFLTIPNVVILMTADLERLKWVCENKYVKWHMKDAEEETLHRFINDYLDKVLPFNMRIYMPELNDYAEDAEVHIDNSAQSDLMLNNHTEKGLILDIMSQKYQIWFDPCRNRKHFLQSTSLRALVNYFEWLFDVNQGDGYFWLKADLSDRLIERINNQEQRDFLHKTLNRDYSSLNQMICNYLISQMSSSEQANLGVEGNSLGDVLYLCSLFEKQDDNADFINCVLYYYSIILAHYNNKELSGDLIGESIFGNWEYGLLTPSRKAVGKTISGGDQRMKIELNVNPKIAEMLKKRENVWNGIELLIRENMAEIKSWLFTMLYVEIPDMTDYKDAFDVKKDTAERMPIESSQTPNNEEEEEKQEQFIITMKLLMKKNLFGFMKKNNMIEHDQMKLYKHLCKLLKGIIDALLTELNFFSVMAEKDTDFENLKQKLCNEVINESDFSNSVSDFPLQNVEIIYSIGKNIGKASNIFEDQPVKIVFSKIEQTFRLIETELNKIEEEYKKMNLSEFKLCEYYKQYIEVRLLLNSKEFFQGPEEKEKFEKRLGELYKETDTTLAFGEPGT